MDLRPLALALVACTGGQGPDGSNGAYVYGRFSTLLGAGVEDAAVCADAACTVTDDHGEFSLDGLPTDADVVVRVDKDSFFPVTLPHHTADSEPAWEKKLLAASLMASQGERVGATLDPSLGQFSFGVYAGHFRDGTVASTAGVSFSLDPDPGFDPYYLTTPLQLADTSLAATTAAGVGGAFDLPPGEYAVTFDNPGGPCSHILGWAFAPGEPAPIVVEAGRGTWIDVLCPPE